MMSSSINLDLDFQEYGPSSSASFAPSGGYRGDSSAQQRPPVELPPQNLQNVPSSSKSIFNLIQDTSKSSPGTISNEALQQLLWLTGKQKSKEQRDSITAGSNWGLGYLARYFDITTQDVLERIIWSAIPIRKTGFELDKLTSSTDLMAPLALNEETSQSTQDDSSRSEIFDHLGKRKHYSYIERFIQSRPDFYGPFWVSTTLIFAIAIFSNIVSFVDFQSERHRVSDLSSKLKNMSGTETILEGLDQGPDWHYSVEQLSMAASLVISYVLLVPTMLWFFFWFRGCTKYYTLTETVCAYGYSLSIFVPLSAVLMLQTATLRYIVILLGASLSGLVLFMSFLPIVNSDPNSGGSHIILVMVAVCQLALAYLIHRIMLQ